MKKKPVLIIFDLMMPSLGGYQVLNSVRNTDEVSDIKILVISSLNESCIDKAMSCGADVVLQRPFENEQLLQTIETLLERKRTHKSVRSIV